MPELTESELKVLLYIIRRIFGFKKDADTISLKQMVEGIRTRDDRQLDRGAGVSKTSAVHGAAGLVEKGIGRPPASQIAGVRAIEGSQGGAGNG